MRNSPTRSKNRRGFTVFAAVSALILTVPMAFAADSYPPIGDSAVASAHPVVSGYRVQDIRDWSPESDPYAKHLRASVPLQSRIEHNPNTQVKPELDGKAEIMLMQGDYGNSFFGSTTHNNTFGDLAFNFWQYTDYFSPWHGGASIGVPQAIYDPKNSDWRNRGFEFGIMTLPSPEYTNAAHRNGVKSVAILYFDPYFRPGLTFREMFEKDPQSDGYVIANKLVEMANYYGFDGYFLNEEEGGAAKAEFKPFMSYLTSKGLYTQWYDTNSSFNAQKAQWLRDDTHGRIHNSVFVNYGNDGKAMRTYADANGYDPYAEVFAGIEANQTNFRGDGGVSRGFLSADNHSPVTSLALFTPSDMYQRGLDDDIKSQAHRESREFPFMQQQPYQWMIAERERMYFSGPHSDVMKTGAANVVARPEVGVVTKGWIGVADFTPARSVISGPKFASTFSTGKGMRSYTNGTVTNDSEWTDIGAQAILPSWQWWFETANDVNVSLHADFDYGEEPRLGMKGEDVTLPFKPVGAYNGGNSLVVYGDAAGNQTLRLFKTDLMVEEDSSVTVTWRATNPGDASVSLGLIFADAPKEVVSLDLGEAPEYWETTTIDLTGFAGRRIATIGLVFKGDAAGTQFNFGELTVGPKGGDAPATPTGLQIDELLSDGQMNVSWNRADFSEVDYYILEAVGADGSAIHLARTYGDVRYVKDVPGDRDFVVRLRAIGKDGSSSAPVEVEVPRTQLPRDVAVIEEADANKYFMQAKTAKEVTISWAPPIAGAPEAYYVRIETLFAGEENPYKGYAHTIVPGSENTVTLQAPPEGLQFRATVTPIGKEGPGMSARSRYHDALARPLEIRDVVFGSGLNYHLNNPTTTDWQKLVSKGDDEWTATRGKNANRNWGNSDPNAWLTKDRQLEDTVSYTIVDYAGNESDAFKLTVAAGSINIVDEAAPRVWASPWNDQDVQVGAEIEPITVSAVDNVSKVSLSVGFVSQPADGLSPSEEPKPTEEAKPDENVTAGEEATSAENVTIEPETIAEETPAPVDTPAPEEASAPEETPAPGKDTTPKVVPLSDGISFDPETGVISGLPTWKGKRIVRITAEDESGNAASMEIAITVHDLPVPETTPTEPPVDPTQPTVEPTQSPVDPTQPPAFTVEPTRPPVPPVPVPTPVPTVQPPVVPTTQPTGGAPTEPPTVPTKPAPGAENPIPSPSSTRVAPTASSSSTSALSHGIAVTGAAGLGMMLAVAVGLGMVGTIIVAVRRRQ